MVWCVETNNLNMYVQSDICFPKVGIFVWFEVVFPTLVNKVGIFVSFVELLYFSEREFVE